MKAAAPRRGHDKGVKTVGSRDEPADASDILVGPHAVLEALRAGRRRIRRILVARRAQGGITGEVVEIARRQGLLVQIVPRIELDRFVRGGAHQGLVAEGGPFPYVEPEQLLSGLGRRAGRGFLVVLDGIQDPQNLGAIVRTAEAAGVDGLVLPRDRAAGVTPAAVRASAGATEHLPIARVTNLAAFLNQAKGAGLWVVGADPSASEPLYAADLTVGLALVIGSEGRGLRPLVRSRCDRVVRIPVKGGVASLNASAAAAICIFESVRQRGERGGGVRVDRSE